MIFLSKFTSKSKFSFTNFSSVIVNESTNAFIDPILIVLIILWSDDDVILKNSSLKAFLKALSTIFDLLKFTS